MFCDFTFSGSNYMFYVELYYVITNLTLFTTRSIF